MKFKIGDRVKVIRKSVQGEIFWSYLMNKTIGKIYTVLEVNPRTGNLNLNTELDTGDNFWYSPKGVDKISTKNQQRVFEFMS